MSHTPDQHRGNSRPSQHDHAADHRERESGSASIGSVVTFPVRDVARGPARRQSGTRGKVGETVPVSDPAVTIDHGSVSLVGVTVWGMPGLSKKGGVIALQVEPRPAQRPRPRLVYDRGNP